jgi:hypothetical protein
MRRQRQREVMSVVAPNCAQVPEYLRKGPVSPVGPLTVATNAIAMAIYWPGVPSSPPVGVELAALREAAGGGGSWWLAAVARQYLRSLHCLGFLYGVGVLAQMWWEVGSLWPTCTYTVTSWNLQTL